MRFSFDKMAQLVTKRKIKVLSTSACLIGLAGLGFYYEIYPKRSYCEARTDFDNNQEFYDYKSCKKFIKQYKVTECLCDDLLAFKLKFNTLFENKLGGIRHTWHGGGCEQK
jgi:hypothetical protein